MNGAKAKLESGGKRFSKFSLGRLSNAAINRQLFHHALRRFLGRRWSDGRL
jgi:hypothetical protein